MALGHVGAAPVRCREPSDVPVLGKEGGVWRSGGWAKQAGYSPHRAEFSDRLPSREGASACWFLRQSGQLFSGVGMGTLPGVYVPGQPPSVQGDGVCGRRAGWRRGCPSPSLHRPHTLHLSPVVPSTQNPSVTPSRWGLPQAKTPACRRRPRGPSICGFWMTPAPGGHPPPGGRRAPACTPRGAFLDPLLPWPLAADVPSSSDGQLPSLQQDPHCLAAALGIPWGSDSSRSFWT